MAIRQQGQVRRIDRIVGSPVSGIDIGSAKCCHGFRRDLSVIMAVLAAVRESAANWTS
jgi:hypothetical protein